MLVSDVIPPCQVGGGELDRRAVSVVLVSTYELGRQPFGLASPASWLRQAGANVTCLDLSVEKLDESIVKHADLIAFYLPMHTATRIAVRVLDTVIALNPSAHVCAYGLYAPVNESFLRQRGVQTILGGEFEAGLVSLADRLQNGWRLNSDTDVVSGTNADRSSSKVCRELQGEPGPPQVSASTISLAKQRFRVPDRTDLPPLEKYAQLRLPDGSCRIVGYTEATRGCKHLCRHCPIVPVYNGRFRVIQPDVVLEDIGQQVALGAEHITFGDPDFFNGPKHAVRIVRALHDEYSWLSYDVTIKVEHLLKHAEYLPVLRDTGCNLVTTAVESLDDRVLRLLDKGHTRADFIKVVELFAELDMNLQPTFVTFTPWTSLEGYRDLLATLAELGLVENVAPIQLAIRLLIPAGSRLLELPEVHEILGPFDETALSYRWNHPDPRVDSLQRDVERLVESAAQRGAERCAIFLQAWELLHHVMDEATPALPLQPARCTIPFLTEPWYC